MVAIEDICDDEWAEWYRLTPIRQVRTPALLVELAAGHPDLAARIAPARPLLAGFPERGAPALWKRHEARIPRGNPCLDRTSSNPPGARPLEP
jgi:hypothetical protein